jgi:hypothetical protein
VSRLTQGNPSSLSEQCPRHRERTSAPPRHREVRRVRRRRQNDPVNRFEQRTRSDPARGWRKAPSLHPSLRGAKRRGNPASSCTTSWIASQARNDDSLPVIANERPPPVIASEREAIQLETGERLRVSTRHCEEQSDAAIQPLPAPPAGLLRKLAMTAPSPVIANEREAIQLETGERLRVPTPSLRGAKRRGNPAFSCTTNWIASLPLAMTPSRHRERTSAPTVIANERPPPVIASEREAIQLMPTISRPNPTPPPFANHQLDCVAPARNDGAVIANERPPQPSSRTNVKRSS